MRKQLHYVALFLLTFNSNTLIAKDYVDLYINTYKNIAIQEMMRSGIPASITLAQGIHESAWGRGELALNSNNHFGIKCKDYWTGSSFYFKDDDYDEQGNLIKSCFRAYENPEKSYIDHTDFLMTTAHYQVLFNYSNTDYMRWAKGLKKCGYATDKEYANKLISTIEKYKLHRFDLQMDQREMAYIPTPTTPQKDITDLIIRNENNDVEQLSAMDIPKAIMIPDDYTRRIEEVETINYVDHQTLQFIPNEGEAIEETIPGRSDKDEYKEEIFNDYKTEPIQETRNNVQNTINKESIIPAAFASTKQSYHLTRKPRSENLALR